VLLGLGRNDEALALLRSIAPQIFAEPPPVLYPGDVPKYALVAVALLRTGATNQGRALLQQVVAVFAAHPENRSGWELAWWDVIAFTLLGESDKSIAALQAPCWTSPRSITIHCSRICAPIRATRRPSHRHARGRRRR